MENAPDVPITALRAEYLAEARSGSRGQNSIKTKTAIRRVSVSASVPAEVRPFDRLFAKLRIDASERTFLDLPNADCRTVLRSHMDASQAQAQFHHKLQIERIRYVVAGSRDHTAERPVFNLATSPKVRGRPPRCTPPSSRVARPCSRKVLTHA